MANIRQYIGARYVTKIYENSLDPSSAEWESGVAYEPLTLVTYNNSSYLSKKDVPASIGNPASNPSYWVVTGAYNGQIATLQSQIDNINNVEIPALQADIAAISAQDKRNYIVIGDSFSYGVITAGTYGQGWIDQLVSLYPEKNIYYLPLAEAVLIPGVNGFASSHKFLTLLQEIEAYYPNMDKNTITDIVVIGGTNDSSYTTADIESNISDFCDYAKTNYKNANIRIGIFGTRIQTNETVVKAYANCQKYGATFMMDIWGLVASMKYSSDGTHLSQQGYDLYCPYIADSIINGHTCFTSYEQATMTPIASGDTNDYKINVINTEESMAIEFPAGVMLSDTGTGPINITLTGDALFFQHSNSGGNAEIYGLSSGGDLEIIGRCNFFFVNDTTLRIGVTQIKSPSAYSAFRIAFKNSIFQTRNPNVLN